MILSVSPKLIGGPNTPESAHKLFSFKNSHNFKGLSETGHRVLPSQSFLLLPLLNFSIRELYKTKME